MRITDQDMGNTNIIKDQEGILHFIVVCSFDETQPDDRDQSINRYLTHFWSENNIDFNYEKIEYWSGARIQLFQYESGIGLIYPDYDNRVMVFWSWIKGNQQKTVFTPPLDNINVEYVVNDINATYLEFFLIEKILLQDSTQDNISVYSIQGNNVISELYTQVYLNNYTKFGPAVNYQIGTTDDFTFLDRIELIDKLEGEDGGNDIRIYSHTYYNLETMNRLFSLNTSVGSPQLYYQYNSSSAIVFEGNFLGLLNFETNTLIAEQDSFSYSDVIMMNNMLYAVKEGGRSNDVNVFRDIISISIENLQPIQTFEIKLPVEVDIRDTFIDIVDDEIVFGIVRTPLSTEFSQYSNINIQTLLDLYTRGGSFPTYFIPGTYTTSDTSGSTPKLDIYSVQFIAITLVVFSIMVFIYFGTKYKWR